jgi:hypothetical protein
MGKEMMIQVGLRSRLPASVEIINKASMCDSSRSVPVIVLPR